MKSFFRYPVFLFILSYLFFSCQKEVSFEKGNSTESVGSLQVNATTGVCLGVVVNGVYKKDSVFNSSHYIDINVKVDTIGSYSIATDTANGFYFRATGSFTTTGVQLVKLKAFGKPIAVRTNVFTANYHGTSCEFPVTVLAGTGGSGIFTLNGSPNNCTGAVVNGTYEVGTSLISNNTVVLNISVTTIGTWSLATTTTNGMTFSGSGNFINTGAQTITLLGTGTPLTAGAINIPVTVGTTTCTFSVTCVAIPDYFPRTTYSNWSYEIDGIANDSILMKVIPETHTANGNNYKIFMWTDNAAMGFDTAGYYRKAGSDYWEWIDMGDYIGFDNSLWLEYNFLKDNLNSSATWNTQTFTGTVTPTGGTPINVSARFLYTILQKDVIISVNGTNYANTIVVKEELQQLQSGNWVTLTAAGHVRSYFSRDKGLIKQDFYDAAGMLDTELNVRRLIIY